ncbi:hypothetical protein ABIB28_000639 [Sphingomonas sp. UYEF23]
MWLIIIYWPKADTYQTTRVLTSSRSARRESGCVGDDDQKRTVRSPQVSVVQFLDLLFLMQRDNIGKRRCRNSCSCLVGNLD